MRFNMPIFDKHNLLFIHIPKTAGGSVESVLSELSNQKLNSRHIIFDRLARFNELRQNQSRMLFGIDSKRLVLQHLTPMEMVGLGYLSAQQYKKLNRFTVIRDPVKRAISQYFSHRRHQKYENFQEFIDKFIFGELTSHNDISHRRPQSDFLWLNGKLDEDIKLIQFEKLDIELKNYLSQFGLTIQTLPHKNPASIKPTDFTISQKSRLKLEDYYFADFNLWHSIS